ncbi:hypothetical protein [Streptomyces gossypiisoli]|uniref:hypothetical protein n=1 Tax=Streptomyces gossypiisoli TaxID=2748864 RepID=UPI0015D9BA89|nr:hypothetical protein [Streptomyces gossypiisoli]
MHDAAATVMAQHTARPEGLSVSANRVHGLFADAFAGGLHLSLLVDSLATLLATAAVALFLPRQQPQPTPAAP